jgi:hypothetical protein
VFVFVRRGSLALVVAVSAAGVLSAQRQQPFTRGFRQAPPRFASTDSYDGAFSFCRLMYTSVRREAGGAGWTTDYPDADTNFSIRLSELTKTRVGRQPDGEPNYLVVRPMDDALFECPFVQLSDAGTAGFEDDEVERLRTYLLKGGFLWADDFWGTEAWEHWRALIARVLPATEFPVVDLEVDHPLFKSMFEIGRLPQIPSIRHWRPYRNTSERGADSPKANFRGIFGPYGRLMVLMTHNTDIADAWEREGEDRDFFYNFSPDGYAVGINVLLYVMAH